MSDKQKKPVTHDLDHVFVYLLSVAATIVTLALCLRNTDEIRLVNSFYDQRYVLGPKAETTLRAVMEKGTSEFIPSRENMQSFYRENGCSDVYYDGKLIASKEPNLQIGVAQISPLCSCLNKVYQPMENWFLNLTNNNGIGIDSAVLKTEVENCYSNFTGHVVKIPNENFKYNYVYNILVCICAVATASTPCLFGEGSSDDFTKNIQEVFRYASIFFNLLIVALCTAVLKDNTTHNSTIPLLILLWFLQIPIIMRQLSPNFDWNNKDNYEILQIIVLFTAAAMSLIIYMMAMLHLSNIREYSILLSCILLGVASTLLSVGNLPSQKPLRYMIVVGILLILSESCNNILSACTVVLGCLFLICGDLVQNEDKKGRTEPTQEEKNLLFYRIFILNICSFLGALLIFIEINL